MPLVPMNQVGGLDIGGNLLSQSVKRARDNLNLSQDVDGTLITRYPGAELEYNGQPLSSYLSGNFFAYKAFPYVGSKSEAAPVIIIQDNRVGATNGQLAVFDMAADTTNTPVFAQSTNPPFTQTGAPSMDDADFTEIDELLAFTPVGGTQAQAGFAPGVQQYDGLKWHRAGLPQPYFFEDAPPDTWVRILYATVDFQGNETYGQFTQLYIDRTGAPETVTIVPAKVDGNPTNSFLAPDYVKSSGADRNALDQGFDDKYFRVSATGTGSVSFNSGTQEMTVTTTENNLSVGDWIQFAFGSIGGPITSQEPTLMAMRVKSIAGLDVVFDASASNTRLYINKSYWIKAEDWIQYDAGTWNSYFPISLFFLNTSNVWLFVFTSPNQFDSYYLADTRPVAFLGTSYSYTAPYTTSSVGGNAAQLIQPFRIPTGDAVRLEDVIDDTSVKIPFPDNTTLLTVFDNLALAANTNEVYWSDTSLGGSSFMTTGLDNTVPGTSKEGPITGLSAADEFVFVGRKYRNYSIIGTLPTFNFQINPYAIPTPGPNYFGNVITVGGSVYFGNTLGMWEAFGTNMRPIGQAILGAFYRESDPHYVAGTSTPLRFLAQDGSYDSLKGRCIWKVSNPADSNVLDWAIMLDTKTGEWFRWNLMGQEFLQLINGLWYTADGASNEVLVEDVLRTNPVESYHVTTWSTVDNPSLEKQYTQIKVFCRSENDNELEISTFRDWSETEIPNENLVIDPIYELSQKKKVDSNKSLAFSIKIKPADDQVMQIEGIEIEFNPIQEGMKR